MFSTNVHIRPPAGLLFSGLCGMISASDNRSDNTIPAFTTGTEEVKIPQGGGTTCAACYLKQKRF